MLFFSLLDMGVSWMAVLLSFVVAFVTSGLATIFSKRKYILPIWVFTYLFVMLYITILGRTPNEGVRIHLVPLWSIHQIESGLIEILYEKVFNVLFFVPYGTLIGLWFSRRLGFFVGKASQGCKQRAHAPWFMVKRTMIVGAITSACIELMQLITKTGFCETDDVICNAVGCALGAGIACLILKIYRMLVNGK